MTGEESMERTIRIGRREPPLLGEAQTPLPGRRSLTRRRLTYRLPDSARRPAADARSPRASGLNNSRNIDKFTGFFDKLPEMFGTFYESIFNGLRISDARFQGNSGQKKFKGYVKFKRGIFPPGASQ